MPAIIVLPVAPSSELQIVAGDIGVTVQVPADIVQSLTGAHCTVAITSPIGARQTVSATPSADGTNATFATTAGTFPLPGTYDLQLEAVFASPAQTLYTSTFSLEVGARI